MYASVFYIETVRLTLFSKHEQLGKKDISDNNINGALFHFKSMIYLMEDDTHELITELSDDWSFSYPLKGVIANYFYDDFAYRHTYKISMGTARALYGFALEKNGNEDAALFEYVVSSNILGLKNYTLAKKLAEISQLKQ
jgi:hypothetical protein